MCIGNTTSPAANNTTNVRYGWGDPNEWERPEVITPGPQVQDQGGATQKKSSLKAKPKSQSSKTSGGTY
tara:strand:- start:69 stop:275 length:207 start_codon:yes stop_codon:yes gene_type:complete